MLMPNFPQTILRHQLAWLRARYDGGAIPPGIYVTIKTVETEIAWHDHRAELTNLCMSTDLPPNAKGENRHG
jgi:hypothetical protein